MTDIPTRGTPDAIVEKGHLPYVLLPFVFPPSGLRIDALRYRNLRRGRAGSPDCRLRQAWDSLQTWLTSLTYGCTYVLIKSLYWFWQDNAKFAFRTPVSHTIGLATQKLYSLDSGRTLLLVRILNIISENFIIFTLLIELMPEEFFRDESWRVLRDKQI